jgi:phage terminase large subunit GpA-like protein
MLPDHLTSEQPIAVTARGQTVDEWKLFPGRENHHFDYCVMATVAASAAGITAVGAEASPERQRRRVEVLKPGAQRKTIATKRGKLRSPPRRCFERCRGCPVSSWLSSPVTALFRPFLTSKASSRKRCVTSPTS